MPQAANMAAEPAINTTVRLFMFCHHPVARRGPRWPVFIQTVPQDQTQLCVTVLKPAPIRADDGALICAAALMDVEGGKISSERRAADAA
jgi:hypothetical protein